MCPNRHYVPAVAMTIALAASAAMAQEKVLFIGNSFTNQGPVPALVRALAIDAGWQTPTVVMQATVGESLAYQRTNAPTLASVDLGGWNHVVLQDLSVRPTDAVGLADVDPAGFKDDATWFYDRVKATSPAAEVVLYETWARREDFSYYPTYYADRTAMQNQLNFHYHDAAENYIPTHATAARKTDVVVAPVGEAWQKNYIDGGMNLHATDKYHGNDQGEYLNALVLYGTIFNRSTVGLIPLNNVSTADARTLQHLADTITGITTPGGASGQVKPRGIFNASFESPVLADGAYTFANGYGVAEGWIINNAGTNGAGTRNAKADFPNTTVTGGVDQPLIGPADGLQYLTINSGVAIQQLTNTLEADSVYTLNVATGRRNVANLVATDYFIRLFAGDTLLAEFAGNTGDITPGTFVQQTLNFTSGSLVGLDQRLRIEMGHPAGTTGTNGLAFDNLNLAVAAVPEPAAIGVIGLSLSSLLLRRRRR